MDGIGVVMEIPQGYKKSTVGVIPVDWEVSLLDSVAKRGSGHTPDKKHPEYWNGNIKWISLKDSNTLDDLYIYDTVEKITPLGIANSSAVLHPMGTVVLSRDAGVGKSAITKDVMAVSQHFMAWECGLQLENHFLYYWLQSNKIEFERIAIGSTIKTIGLPYFKKLKIPLPPLPEQKAIALSLSDTDALIAACDRAITKKRNIKQGAMQQLLTGKMRLPGFSGEEEQEYKQTEMGVIPDDWKIKKIIDCAEYVDYRGKTPKKTKSGRFLVTAKNIREGFIDYEISQEFVAEDEYELIMRRGKPKIGDVLITTEAPVGNVAVVDRENVALAQRVIKYRSKNSDILNQVYFKHYLLGEQFQKKIDANSSGSTAQGIKGSVLHKLLVILPPLLEQKAIAQILSDMDAEIVALEKKRDKYKAIKQGMMQELLTGKTRLKDDADKNDLSTKLPTQ